MCPIGADEDDNVKFVVGNTSQWLRTKKLHWDLGEDLDIMTGNAGHKVTGVVSSSTRTWSSLRTLSTACWTNMAESYTEVITLWSAMILCLVLVSGQKFGGYFWTAIPITSSNRSLTNYYRDEILDGGLPITSYYESIFPFRSWFCWSWPVAWSVCQFRQSWNGEICQTRRIIWWIGKMVVNVKISFKNWTFHVPCGSSPLETWASQLLELMTWKYGFSAKHLSENLKKLFNVQKISKLAVREIRYRDRSRWQR